MSEYLRGRAAAMRRAAPGQAPLPVYRPAASRFLIAGLCAWIMWQPLKGADATAAEGQGTLVTASALAGHPASVATAFDL